MTHSIYRSLSIVLVAVSLLASSAAAESIRMETPAPRPGAPSTEVITAHILAETLDPHKLAVAIDRFDGLEAPDGRLDELLVFVSEEPLQSLSYEGFGVLRIEDRRATVVLSRSEQVLLLSLSNATPPTPPGADGRSEHLLSQGVALVRHVPAERQSLAEAIAAERTRKRVIAAESSEMRRITARELNKDPNHDDGSGETCKTSCSTNCTDGSFCSVTCNENQCGECECPANCYCRTRL